MKLYLQALKNAVSQSGSVLCVGLDPDLNKIPDVYRQPGASNAAMVEYFCKSVVRATSDFCASFKPNLAFFEALGADGLRVFAEVCAAVPSGKLIIADAKRGDIGNTAAQYAHAFLDVFGCDAVTVSPLMGGETLRPFLNQPDKAIYSLVLTSNPGAVDFLEQTVGGDGSLALRIAEHLALLEAEMPGHSGMVIGATRPDRMQPLLAAHPAASVLLPGLGAQGGDLATMMQALNGHNGIPVVPVSRGILYGDVAGEEGFRRRAKDFHEQLKPLSSRYA